MRSHAQLVAENLFLRKPVLGGLHWEYRFEPTAA